MPQATRIRVYMLMLILTLVLILLSLRRPNIQSDYIRNFALLQGRRGGSAARFLAPSSAATVGFHNFNLRIFNLRVSNPDKLFVDVFLTRCRISMCQGLGPKKHDEISEIDRTGVCEETPVSGAGL